MKQDVNVVCILLDTLNRHFLSVYGNDWVKTPNIERLAKRSIIFENHYMCSAPCMPARHDIFTGWADFLWRPWGSLEPWDNSLIKLIKQKGVTTQLFTDHYHLFERGGENYHIDFDGWEFIRGHENDPWITKPVPKDPHLGILTERYSRNKSRFKKEEDFMSPRTFSAAADWLEENHDKHKSFFLMIDEFDPHEPFHTPLPYSKMYDKDWDGPDYYWEPYGKCNDDEKHIKHIRAQYAAKVTMVDHWLGKLLDKFDELDLWNNTVVILMTDHGHYLGEHGWYGKPPCTDYQTFAHLPLLMHLPGDIRAGEREKALTSNIDIYATILDIYGLKPVGYNHSCSLLPLAEGKVSKVRDWILYGGFGRGINYTDGHYTYHRAPVNEDNQPLYMYSQRWSTAPWWEIPVLDDEAEVGTWIPQTNIKLFRKRIKTEEMKKINCDPQIVYTVHQLFNVDVDEEQNENLAGTEIEKEYIKKLIEALKEWKAPIEHMERLGLKEE